jgi:nucleoside-diphosphate-sugar epimerase
MWVRAGNAVSFRFATAFGASPSMRFDLLVNDFTRQAVQTGVLKLYESHFRRTFIHVRDMARSLVFALVRWDDLVDEAYNVGVESLNLTKRAVADRIARYVPLTVQLVEAGADADLRDYEVSYAKLRSRGFTTRFGIDEGIAELVRAVRLMRVA